MTAPTALEQAITADGIRSVNFFNGRLLTGEDLSREQGANELARLRLGQAAGSGVASGLEVSGASGGTIERPVLTIEKGLAVAASGRVLALGSRVDVALTRDPIGGTATPGLVFADCAPTQPATYTAGAGVYLLTIAPAQAREGRAPTSGLGNVDATCATAYFVEGVQFRLIRLTLPAADVADEERLRNRIAYRMFGSSSLAELARNPFGDTVARWSLLDDLADVCLGEDEVPLATMRWTSGAGLRYVDLWSVRRRMTRPTPTLAWPGFAGDRVIAEGEARFLQFQAELADLLESETNPETTKATDHFTHLPPLGLVPVGSTASSRGFHQFDFFDGLKTRNATPIYIEGSVLTALVRSSFAFPPFETSTSELVWLYSVRENAQDPTAQQYVVFTNPHMPFAGDPRADIAYWDFANYPLLPV
jgi:hypothetical protein